MRDNQGIHDNPVRTIIALGCNIPECIVNLQSGLDEWRKIEGVEIIYWSRVYESKPMGENLEGDFLNAVIVCDTTLTPRELLQACHVVESKCGRDRNVEKTSNSRNRTMDCDIIFYGDMDLKIRTSGSRLTIPHPEWQDRAFVVLPLLDVIDHLTPHQAELVRIITKSRKFEGTSCHQIENMLH